jgi:hypothetical protein
MTNLERRLKKLEPRRTDGSCFVPHTSEWLDYWSEQIDRYATGRLTGVLFPIEALEAWVRNADSADETITDADGLS